MQHEVERYLYDIRSACVRTEDYLEGPKLQHYSANAQVGDSVERGLEIIGEAVRRGIQYLPEMPALFPDASSIIGLRNVLAHDYAK